MKSIYTLFGISLVAASIMLVASHVTLKNIDQLGAAQPSVEQLLAQLKSLQAQLAAKQAQIQTTYQFTRVLKVGDKGEDVRQLQILLNKDTLTQIAVSGDGSPGKETTYFGPATSRAVSKFQEKYKSEILTPNQLTKGTGTVGNATIKKLNTLVAVTKTTGTPGNVAVITNNPNVTSTTPTQTNTTPTNTTSTSTNTNTSNTSTSSSLLPPTNCGAPLITSATSASGTVGSSFTYNISITSIAAPTFSASGLPSGLSLSGSRISGTPTTAGTYTTTITATSNCGTGTKVVTITISAVTPPVASGAIITPGSGFSGATAQPGNQGNSSQFGYTDNAIALWDTAPYQAFSGNFNVGVVAFHNSGIAHVDFSVNGGPWTSVTQATPNPQTANNSGVGINYDASGKGTYNNGIVEYWGTLRASDFQDGQIEVRAIAYPNVGVPRVLESLYLQANATGGASGVSLYVSPQGSDTTGDGSQAKPFATILAASRYWLKSDGSTNTAGLNNATIYLAAGTYSITSDPYPHADVSSQKGWVTIMPAPGVSRSNVIVTPALGNAYGTGLNLKLTHWKNITVRPDSNSWSFFDSGPSAGSLWIDGVDAIGPGAETNYQWWGTNRTAGRIYITDSSFAHAVDGIWGTRLARNVSIKDILSDVHRGWTGLLVNIESDWPHSIYYGTNLVVDSSDNTLVSPDGYTPKAINTNYLGVDINGGAGWTSGHYDIVGIVNGKWKLSAAPAPAGSTGASWMLYTGAHSDFLQNLHPTGTNISNLIIYGLKGEYGDAAGITSGSADLEGSVSDAAIVNLTLKGTTHGLGFSYAVSTTNFLIKNTDFGLGYSFWNTQQGFQGKDVVLDDVINMSELAWSTPGVTLRGTSLESTVPPVVTLTPSASSITSGQSVTITWSTTAAINCTASGDWSGTKPTSGSQTFSTLATNATFTLACVGPGGSANKSVTVAVTSSPADIANLPNGLVGYYTFDGNSNDTSGSGNNGTIQNSPTYVSGKMGQAISLNGNNQNITTNVSVGPVHTFSAWVKWNGSGMGNQTILSGGVNDPDFYVVTSSNSFSLYDNAYGFTYPAPSITPNTWTLFTAVSDGSTLKFYLNGTLYGTYSYVSSTWSKIQIGGNYLGYFNGLIDDVRIYNRVLSPTEVQALYNISIAGLQKQSFMAAVGSAIWNFFTTIDPFFK